MRLVIATLLLASSMLSPLVAHATDDQVEATIAAISADGTTMSLDDGNTYVLPGEFDLEGLEEGTRVYVYFTEEDGQRRVFDLEVVN